MLQDSQTSQTEVVPTPPPVPTGPPPLPDHPRFAKPQRVAFVQACWHRDVVEEARIAFVGEAAALHLTHVDVFEVPGSFEI
ncbi:6,7-dimethyl-8-ribityllumazine synthase, partial [Staphylococcus aureus]